MLRCRLFAPLGSSRRESYYRLLNPLPSCHCHHDPGIILGTLLPFRSLDTQPRHVRCPVSYAQLPLPTYRSREVVTGRTATYENRDSASCRHRSTSLRVVLAQAQRANIFIGSATSSKGSRVNLLLSRDADRLGQEHRTFLVGLSLQSCRRQSGFMFPPGVP